MNNQSNLGYKNSLQESLKLNGRVSASISHDIKNVLAIINENAGLLQDISSMIEEGFILSPKRLNTIASKIENQVSLANDIISRLNRFAHSVDEEIVEYDIYEVIDYMCKIFDRIGKSRGLKIEIEKPCDSIKIKSNLFYFQFFLWNSLDYLSKNINKETILNISINFEDNTYYIIFTLSENLINGQCFYVFFNSQFLEDIDMKLKLSEIDKGFKLVINI